ncbi:hypothetical protein HG535_0A03720 [Zygotorulaspora mrakii]|uniref:Glycoside hydrolase family 5 domain-containing protein n=1 Tax=Zygotorulaspora mrakii TaxID=42260 RepID=A0A7H9AW44_ZYGMR|nr:uncharacterized protein HG535_0A03720 [Zygotorulaspora mrakii]QLG70433.1 hypothetical protein HG535_0A03720 [Zygotorulaspora mrakii]
MFHKIKQKFESAKEHHGGNSQTNFGISIPTAGDISKREIYRNRYNHGVNLGSCFVNESWIYDTIFEKGGDNEYDAVSRQVKETSVDEAAENLSRHYKEYISKIDWKWLKEEAGITALRVPVGYWHVGNGKFVKSLAFESLQNVYAKAKPWDAFKDLIKKAEENDIGILVDIHGLPGGANTDSHSGESVKTASFFGSRSYVDIMVNEVIPFIVTDVCQGNENIIGLQIVNEAAFDNDAKKQKKYYSRAVKSVKSIDESLPVVISDGWWPQQWSDWLEKEKLDTSVVIDSHVYRCFSDDDKSKNADSICKDIPNSINFPRDKADYVVGEFSCVLDGETWSKTKETRDECVKKFGNSEIKQFSQVASWGWFFWTLQFKYGDGGEWGLKPMTEKGAIPKRPKDASIPPDENKIKDIIKEHNDYWKDKGGDKMEHWRFEDAIRCAIADIEAFHKFDGSRLGRWHAWSEQRKLQHIQEKGESDYIWEWKQGYQRALDEFNGYHY